MKDKAFTNIKIYEKKSMKKGTGICLPPLGIFVSKGASLALKQHEYGHFLQYKAMGFWKFYLYIGIPSIKSAYFNPRNHRLHPVEKDANKRASIYFGKDAPINNQQIWPQ